MVSLNHQIIRENSIQQLSYFQVLPEVSRKEIKRVEEGTSRLILLQGRKTEEMFNRFLNILKWQNF